MAVTLVDLLSDPALGLVAEGAAEPTAEPIRWVAVTELEDPRPFLNGAEVVLTTGVRLTTPASQRAFVRRVHEAGVLAIGFGVGLAHQEIPPALLGEADDLGLPAFRVPYEVPFIAVGKTVADALSADHYSGLEELLEGHASLASTLLGPGGLAALLGELARILRTDVALFQYGARIAGAPRPRDTSAPRGPTADAAHAGGPTTPHRLPIATGLKDRCTLAITEPYQHSAIVDYAQSLISVELTNQARTRTAARTAVG
ncbi:PucR family transcriptional regulator, partial [Vibrio cholerae]|nr:PucR family transcriptional regulator [Vibrio cholerae]